jgi:hypothetical protein
LYLTGIAHGCHDTGRDVARVAVCWAPFPLEAEVRNFHGIVSKCGAGLPGID